MTSKEEKLERNKIRVFWIYFVVAIFLVGWIGWRTQDTANQQERQARETTAFALQTQDCLEQLANVLEARSKLNETNNNLSVEARMEILDFVHDILSPPDQISKMPQSDTEYQEWLGSVIQEHYKNMAEQSERQQAILETLHDKPIPSPQCGHNIPR